MSKTYANVAISDSWAVLVTRVNEIIASLSSEIVTANNSHDGALTIGNVALSGTFSAGLLVANTMRGGTVNVVASMTLNSNLLINSTSAIISGTALGNGTHINTSSIAVGANVLVNSSSIFTGNSTQYIILNQSGIVSNAAYVNNTTIGVGNSTWFASINSSAVWVQNSICRAVISTNSVFIGNSTVNTMITSEGIPVDAISKIFFGDAQANLTANAIGMFIANTTGSVDVTATNVRIGATQLSNLGLVASAIVSVGTTANSSVWANTNTISVGNTIQNVTVNSTSLAINGVVFVSASGGIFSTGDVKLTFKTIADLGWVMMNDGTIGDALSGATRANADCMALFTLIWMNIPNTYVPIYTSTGTLTTRGALALTDWANHKRLALPKALGRSLAISGLGAGLTTRQLGEAIGEETHTMTQAEMVAHSHGYADPGHNHGHTDPTHVHGLGDPGHSHGYVDPTHVHGLGDPSHAHGHPNYVTPDYANWQYMYGGPGGNFGMGLGTPTAYSGTGMFMYGNYTGIAIHLAATGQWVGGNYTGVTNNPAVTGITFSSAGSSAPFNVMQPTSFLNIMIKL